MGMRDDCEIIAVPRGGGGYASSSEMYCAAHQCGDINKQGRCAVGQIRHELKEALRAIDKKMKETPP